MPTREDPPPDRAPGDTAPPGPPALVLSHLVAAQLLDVRGRGQSAVTVTPDLNLTQTEVALHPRYVTFFDEVQLIWSDVEKIAVTKNACFAVREGGIHRIQSFSAITNRFCSLMPTPLAPTLLIGGFPMHRIKDTDPYHDTLSKVRALRPVGGRVLDTTTGLGYTAIEAGKTAAHVLTVELDPAVLAVARLNPWSQPLFENPRISQRMGDIADIVQTLEDGSFSRIIHDPPTLSLAGELYSRAFYGRLFRLLLQSGRLFHYLGNPNSGHGARVTKGAVRRLREAGFARVQPCPEAFGVVAYKR